MPDENRPPDVPSDDNDDEQPNIAPSTLFLEMMREAARYADKEPFDPMTAENKFVEPPEPEPEIKPDEVPPFEIEYVLAPLDEPDIPAELLPDITDDAAVSAEPEPLPEPVAEESPTPTPTIEPELQPVVAEPIVPPPEKVSPPEPTVAEGRMPIYEPPKTEDTISPEDRAALIEAQRVRRIRRRQERTRQRRVGMMGGFFRTGFITFIGAVLASTIFTWFTAPEFITPRVASDLQVAEATSIAASAPLEPTEIPITPNFMQRIGIVSGHRGPENDPGAVCPDGLTEAEINFSVAQLVVRELRTRGYTVDLLDEFDPRLENYQGAAIVSLHSNDCRDYGEYVSGYLVARAAARPSGSLDDVLAECIGLHYGEQTGLRRSYSYTLDMTDYHTFREIHPLTPAAILEMGFMKDDRELLTDRQDVIAQSVIDGILCYLSGENPIPQLTATPAALATAESGGG